MHVIPKATIGIYIHYLRYEVVFCQYGADPTNVHRGGAEVAGLTSVVQVASLADRCRSEREEERTPFDPFIPGAKQERQVTDLQRDLRRR